jgi:hypothetical protein
VAIDSASGRLYVADNGNDRVLSWPSATQFSNGQAADRVIGQPDFTSDNPNIVNASRLHTPSSVAVDKSGNLYVADFANNRVLEYDTPATSDGVADRLFGQPDFSTSDPNHGGLSASSLWNPTGVALESGEEILADAVLSSVDARLTYLGLIEPGTPTQNAHTESFNGTFRAECLDLHWFGPLAHARTIIQTGRRTTPPNGRIAPCSSALQRSSLRDEQPSCVSHDPWTKPGEQVTAHTPR